jgi:hypothetical protein
MANAPKVPEDSQPELSYFVYLWEPTASKNVAKP